MAGWLTNGVGNLAVLTGNEQASFDTELASGVQPQTASLTLQQISTASLYFNSHGDVAGVDGTRFYGSFNIGVASVLTGIAVLVGTTGGTDKWIFELHDSDGVTVATTAVAGTTAGTASTWQQIDFTATYTAAAGTYYIALQSNGTTAKFAAYNAPTSPLVTGSATGVFGTTADITPPTTYTASKAPVALVY